MHHWPIDRYFNIFVHSRQTHLTQSRSDFYMSAPFCRTVAYQHDVFVIAFLVGTVYQQPSPIPLLYKYLKGDLHE